MPPYPTFTSLSFLFFTVLGIICSDGVLGQVRTLVPVTRRSTKLGAREISRAGLRPQPEVWMPFGEGSFASDHTALVYVVDVGISAHEHLPILLLEEFEDLASSISCTNGRPYSSLSVAFREYSDFSLARSEWSSHRDGFILISSHPSAGCNPSDQRAAYIVTRVECEKSTLTCTLQADAIEWRQVGSRMTVKYGQVTPEAFHGDLVRREDSFTSDPLSISMEFPERLPLWPPTEVAGFSIPSDAEGFFATCVGCSLSGDITVGGVFDVDFVSPQITKAWVEVNTTIKAVSRVEMIFNSSIVELEIPVIPRIVFSPWQIPSLFSLGPYFELNLNLAADLKAKKLNFTFGVELEVPAESSARFDLTDIEGSFSRGWSETKVKRLPFILGEIDGPFNIGLNATLASAVGIGVSILGGIGGLTAGPSIEFSAPRLVIDTEEVHDVTSLCKPAGPKDPVYSKAVLAKTFHELAIHAKLAAEGDLPLLPGFDEELSVDIYNLKGQTEELCLAFPGGAGEMLLANETQPDSGVGASDDRGAGARSREVPKWAGIFVGAVVFLVVA